MSRVCIGQIVNVHGLKGMVKIRAYLTNPMDIGRFGPLSDKEGQHQFQIQGQSLKGDFVLATIKGVTDRTMAEKLKGQNLYIDRNQLPSNSDGFYYCDLIGMTVLENGQKFGTVESVQNYGAGDVLDIKTIKGRVFSFDFSKATFPRVDISKKEMDIVVPEGMEVAHED